MATNYPGGYDLAVTIPATLDGTPLHSAMHDNDRDAIVAIEQAVGTNPADGFADVSARIAALEASRISVLFTPAPATDSSTSGGAWITVGAVTIPSWATQARVRAVIAGAYPLATETLQYTLTVRIGTVVGPPHLVNTSTVNDRNRPITIGGLLALSGTGSQTLRIDSTRNAGTSVLRVDTSSRVIVDIDWLR